MYWRTVLVAHNYTSYKLLYFDKSDTAGIYGVWGSQRKGIEFLANILIRICIYYKNIICLHTLNFNIIYNILIYNI